jgi:hypothetical protein
MMNVRASDMILTSKTESKEKSKGKAHPISKLIEDNNITIISLQPGKFLRVGLLYVIKGYAKHNAAKFTLLDNVTYEILDMVPYDVFTGKGTRSVMYDPKEFAISFTTCGTTTPKHIVKALCGDLTRRLTKYKILIEKYKQLNITYYTDADLEIVVKDDKYTFRLLGEYITFAYMIAQRCFILDKNISYCTPSVERYDSEVAIIQIIHADPTALVIESITECINDITILEKALLKHIG